MTRINEKEVNKIAGCNLLHDMINTTKIAKILNIHYSPIIHGCINTRHGRAKFKNFQILLDIVCSSTVVIGILVEKLHPVKYALMQCHMQTGYITTNHNDKADFTLPTLRATNVVTW